MNSLMIEIAENLKEPPVWVVHGVNWRVEVPMNAYNAEFDDETQAYEAASAALLTFKGHQDARKDIFMVMSEGHDVPLLGTTMIVHKRNTDPSRGFFPFTHVILANQGFYRESVSMHALLHADLEEHKQAQLKHESKKI